MLTDLDARLARCTLEDRASLNRRARRLRAGGDGRGVDPRRQASLEQALARSEALYERRRRSVPAVTLPGELPIAAHAGEIVEAIRAHPVVIVSGETGCGKSTQLPKLCLLAGRGVAGQIAHTQPRRVAARSVARRLAEELGQPLGESVGFKVRFDARVRRESHVKVITDGLLLAELGRDRSLRGYDTVIVDEAHERSLNIDFLLGYLRELAARRPELRVVVSSATLDEERFCEFFGGAPLIRVAGRSHPVEIRHRAAQGATPLAEQVREAVDELAREGPGDVLVFLSGEREIHEVGAHLRAAFGPSMEILPLYARLPLAKQDRIFARHERRRVVLATNVAETSITVPGVRYVVDAGLARVGRYSPGSAVQRLPVEPISKASARQRAGRCGREAPGVCVRLYSPQHYEAFPDFAEPEIRRTDLAAVLLRMRALGVRDIRAFPFLDPPGRRHVNDGLRLLGELGALDAEGRLTAIGRQLARLPLDPRVGRMLIAAGEHDCVAEVLVIAAGLAAGDPRERDRERRGPRPQHLRFEDERSDFLRLLRIWEYLHAGGRDGAGLAQRCRKRRLSWPRVQEWREIHLQLSLAAREMGLHPCARPASYARIHRALLAGLLRHVGARRDEREYQGIRGNAFRISKGSGQGERRPRWVLAAEVVDAGSAFAHTVAGIRPQWVEQAAGALLRRSHFGAFWDAARGEPMVFEQTALYALTVTPRRAVRFAPVSEEGAREVFIRAALVEGRLDSEAPFLAANARHLAARRALEARLRRPDPQLSHERLFEFYDARLPRAVWDAAGFEAWWRRAGAAALAELELARHAPPGDAAEEAALARRYPPAVRARDLELGLDYRFAPGEDDDGITVRVPRELLAGIDEGLVEWAVPGLARERTEALLRALPKSMRRRLGPAGEVTDEFLAACGPGDGPLTRALERHLASRHGVQVEAGAWSEARLEARLPAHLRPRYRVLDGDGATLAAGRDLARLRERHGRGARGAPAPAPREVFTRWSFGALPEREPVRRAGSSGWLYPALAARGAGVAIEQVEDRERAARSHAEGLVQLALHAEGLDPARLARELEDRDALCLLNTLVGAGSAGEEAASVAAGAGPCGRLLEDLVMAALRRAFAGDDPLAVRDAAAFEALLRDGRARLDGCLQRQVALVRACLEGNRRLRARLAEPWPQAWQPSLDDAREQLAWLVHQGFVAATPAARLERLPRYLEALELRLDKLRRGGARDGDKLACVRPLWERFLARAAVHRAEGRRDPALARYRWLLEEFRISLFAQELGAAERVSRQRLDRLWDEIPP